MIVRRATHEDILDILMLAKKFWKESKFKNFPFDAEFVHAKLKGTLDDPAGGIFIAVNNDEDIVGLLGGAIYPSVFSPHNVAYEVSWFVEKDARGSKAGIALFKAFEEWARENNCIYLTMSRLEGVFDEQIHNMYTKLGLEVKEHNYFKELT